MFSILLSLKMTVAKGSELVPLILRTCYPSARTVEKETAAHVWRNRTKVCQHSMRNAQKQRFFLQAVPLRLWLVTSAGRWRLCSPQQSLCSRESLLCITSPETIRLGADIGDSGRDSKHPETAIAMQVLNPSLPGRRHVVQPRIQKSSSGT